MDFNISTMVAAEHRAQLIREADTWPTSARGAQGRAGAHGCRSGAGDGLLPSGRRAGLAWGDMTAPRAARLVIDVADLDRAAAFWAAFLDLAVLDRGVDWVDLGPLGESALVLSFQREPRGAGKNHAHLDLDADRCDGGAAGAGGRARALGARPVSELFGGGGGSWQVWRDPEGNEFCLCAESVAMAPDGAR